MTDSFQLLTVPVGTGRTSFTWVLCIINWIMQQTLALSHTQRQGNRDLLLKRQSIWWESELSTGLDHISDMSTAVVAAGCFEYRYGGGVGAFSFNGRDKGAADLQSQWRSLLYIQFCSTKMVKLKNFSLNRKYAASERKHTHYTSKRTIGPLDSFSQESFI
jgi:hypothetical protein